MPQSGFPPRTALVTGASAGIGYELVRQLVRDRGVRVLATARRADRLAALAAEFPEGAITTLAGDLGDADFRSRLWEETLGWAGDEGLDILINNAGVGHYAEFATQDPEHVRRMVDINILALFDLTQKALTHMVPRRRGQIVEVSSVLGFLGLPFSAVYVATKHAVNGLVKSLAYEVEGTGVRVWAACPGRTVSEFHNAALGKSANEPDHGYQEPTDRVVRGILRGLDRRHGVLVFPTPLARTPVELRSWLAWPYEAFMRRWAPGYFRKLYLNRE